MLPSLAMCTFALIMITGMPTTLSAAETCADSKDPLQRLGFQIPSGSAERIDFPIGKRASELRGKLTEKEKNEIASDKKVWERVRLKESRVKPKASDVAIYPASGVDFGLMTNTIEGAGLYIGVDIEPNFTNAQIQKWKSDSTFDAASLFSQRPYVSTIPYMVTGDAGKGDAFGKSHLKNLVASLPDDADVLSLSFILDKSLGVPRARQDQAAPGPHILVTWCHKGVRQSSLLISAPMPTPAEGKSLWWYQQVDKLKPAYGVMKRPQGFNMDEVFVQMCEWTRRRGGYIVSEGGKEDQTQDGPVAACMKDASYKRHEVSAAQVGRTGEGRAGKIFGFDDKAVLIEVFGPKGTEPHKEQPNHAPKSKRN